MEIARGLIRENKLFKMKLNLMKLTMMKFYQQVIVVNFKCNNSFINQVELLPEVVKVPLAIETTSNQESNAKNVSKTSSQPGRKPKAIQPNNDDGEVSSQE